MCLQQLIKYLEIKPFDYSEDGRIEFQRLLQVWIRLICKMIKIRTR